MPIDEIKRVFFVGGGTMGCFNSMVAGIAGYEAVVYDISEEAVQNAPERHQEISDFLVEQQILTKEIIDAGLSHVAFTTNLEQAVKDVDLMSESVPERLELKREVHKQFDELLPSHVIMTTNSSTMVVSEIEDVVKRGDRSAALHFHLMGMIVDLVAGPRTSPKTMDILKRFVRSLGQTPIIPKKEKEGHIFNSMLLGYLREALLLVIDGYADIEDVDRAWMLATRSMAGPFGSMDGVGLNVVLDISESMTAKYKDEPDYERITNFIRPYVERGETGVKAGKGFYTYPDPIWKQPEFLTGENG